MPANPEQLHDAVNRIGASLAASQRSAAAAQSDALRLLREAAAAPERLSAQVNEAASADPTLRCALPIGEDIGSGQRALPAAEVPVVLAVDGSQILADRHEEILFALINIGAVTLRPGSAAAPEVSSDTRVLFGEELFTAGGDIMSEGDLALTRDVGERRCILEMTSRFTRALALCDGPLELWGAKDVSDPKAYEQALTLYLDDLRELQRRDCCLAGYVDKPAADLVVRMLELQLIPQSSSGKARRGHPLRQVSDRWLFGRLLRPGERSAIFALQSSSRSRYGEELAVHFFYLNVGRDLQPVIARVEVPRWVAAAPGQINTLHSLLLDQCAFLAARPYPYILHRAHETARISMQESQQIKLRLLLELRAQGVEPEPVSGKSSAKSVSGIKGRF